MGVKTPENGAKSAKSQKIAKSEKKPINPERIRNSAGIRSETKKARTWRAIVRA